MSRDYRDRYYNTCRPGAMSPFVPEYAKNKFSRLTRERKLLPRVVRFASGTMFFLDERRATPRNGRFAERKNQHTALISFQIMRESTQRDPDYFLPWGAASRVFRLEKRAPLKRDGKICCGYVASVIRVSSTNTEVAATWYKFEVITCDEFFFFVEVWNG